MVKLRLIKATLKTKQLLLLESNRDFDYKREL